MRWRLWFGNHHHNNKCFYEYSQQLPLYHRFTSKQSRVRRLRSGERRGRSASWHGLGGDVIYRCPELPNFDCVDDDGRYDELYLEREHEYGDQQQHDEHEQQHDELEHINHSYFNVQFSLQFVGIHRYFHWNIRNYVRCDKQWGELEFGWHRNYDEYARRGRLS